MNVAGTKSLNPASAAAGSASAFTSGPAVPNTEAAARMDSVPEIVIGGTYHITLACGGICEAF